MIAVHSNNILECNSILTLLYLNICTKRNLPQCFCPTFYPLANEVAKATIRPSFCNILGTYLVLKRIWNPIDFQGQRSRSPGQIFRRGDMPRFALPLFNQHLPNALHVSLPECIILYKSLICLLFTNENKFIISSPPSSISIQHTFLSTLLTLLFQINAQINRLFLVSESVCWYWQYASLGSKEKCRNYWSILKILLNMALNIHSPNHTIVHVYHCFSLPGNHWL